MLYWSVLFLSASIVLGLLGFGLSAGDAPLFRWVCGLTILLFVATLFHGASGGGRHDHSGSRGH